MRVHDPKTDAMTLVYCHQDKSTSIQRKKRMCKIVKQEQDEGKKLVCSNNTPKPDCHVYKTLLKIQNSKMIQVLVFVSQVEQSLKKLKKRVFVRMKNNYLSNISRASTVRRNRRRRSHGSGIETYTSA